MTTAYHLDPNEARAIELLRSIKKQASGKGHGVLTVEVANGVETFFRPAYSEQAPMKKTSC